MIHMVSPRAAMAAIRWVPGLWEVLGGNARGDLTYVDFRRKLGPLALGVDLASDLLRFTSRAQIVTGLEDAPRPERFLRPGSPAI